jgi:hypothetical protein
MTTIHGHWTDWKNSTRKHDVKTDGTEREHDKPIKERDSRTAYVVEVRRDPTMSPTGPFRNFPHAVPNNADDATCDAKAEDEDDVIDNDDDDDDNEPADPNSSSPMVGTSSMGNAVAADVKAYEQNNATLSGVVHVPDGRGDGPRSSPSQSSSSSRSNDS